MGERLSKLAMIPLTEIHVDEEENCRGKIAPVDVFELAQDIKEHGQHEPVIVRVTHPEDSTVRKPVTKPYILVAGFCRYLAHRIIEKHEIEAVIRDMSPLDAVIVNFAENLKRRDLNIMQEANSLRRLVRMGLDRKTICNRIGKSDGWVQPRLYLVQMEPEIQRMAQIGILSAENLRQLWSFKDRDERLAAAKQIRERRERGFIGAVKLKPPKVAKRNRANIKKARDREEINNLLSHLLNRGTPFGLHTRMLAWASGQITDMELCVDIQAYFNDLTKLFKTAEVSDETVTLTTTTTHLEKLKDEWGMLAGYWYQVPQLGIPDMSENLDA
jgi:ParB/RepB/Spo0J family partition protein